MAIVDTGESRHGNSAEGNAGILFYGKNPANGQLLKEPFRTATTDEVDAAANAAADAAGAFAALSGRERGALLRAIADKLAAQGEAITARAGEETGLPPARLQGELARTTGQLRLFAEVVEEGSWVDARVDEALPERKPLPRPDIRSMLRPVGPVAVFGASNFPLAFSVAGGDTASALASGNPVVVKAHPAHPGTSRLTAEAIEAAVREAGLPAGVFGILYDAGVEVGVQLVQHPAIKAVAFTGSTGAGQALMRLAAGRPEPIPCFTEMGSTNPLFILPGALRERAAALAQGLQASFTLGSGQFCTKPGLVFVPEEGREDFVEALRTSVSAMQPHGMLTHGIAGRFAEGIAERGRAEHVQRLADAPASHGSEAALGTASIFAVELSEFLKQTALEEEIFGPTTLLVLYRGADQLVQAARGLRAHLTATIHGTEADLKGAAALLSVLEARVGRILFNGYPTGVEVCPAMVHGGPFPATSDGRFTSVGTRAMLRFARPVCFQDCPDALLPQELRRSNPLEIQRMVNGVLGRS